MNRAQKSVLLIGTVVIAMMGIYPPWIRVEPERAPQPMGYGFLWKPPSEYKAEKANLFGLQLQLDFGPVTANRIDWSRLLTQWATVALVTGSIMGITSSRRRTNFPTGRTRQSVRV